MIQMNTIYELPTLRTLLGMMANSRVLLGSLITLDEVRSSIAGEKCRKQSLEMILLLTSL